MKKFENLKTFVDENIEDKLQQLVPNYSSFRILRQSVDARKRHELHMVYSVEVYEQNEVPKDELYLLEKINYQGPKPIIIGTGPAGLFAALRLVERGVPSIIFERGSSANERMKGINRFWRYGELDPQNNVCFGEGGAGLYSDGKLITRIKSEHIPYVLQRLVKFGAPEEIQYLANPHVGSDRIRRVIPKLREYLTQNGCEIHFDTQVTDLLTNSHQNQVIGVKTIKGETFHSDHVVLASGHSANDIFTLLKKMNVFMEGKSFAVGLRIEHPQKFVNETQYRKYADHPKLGAANYKLTHHDEKSGVGVYSFCMCPGGYVISASTEATGVVCNGMSNYHRNSPYANAAIVVTVDYEKHFGKDLFGGLDFRKELETKAREAVVIKGGTKHLPAQKVQDFLKARSGEVVKGSSPSDAISARLDQILPSFITQKLSEGLEVFHDKMKGFIHKEAQLFGVESRTSCPIRITRNEQTLESISHKGLYPTGEGAGYAGGITSAAVDGIKVAEAILAKM